MPASSFVQQAWRIAWKDLQVELRSKEILYTMVFFGLLIAVIDGFTFPENVDLARIAVPAMLWGAMAFTGTIGLGRAFDRERENDTLRALLLTPVSRLAIFLGKAIAITLLVFGVGVVVSILLTLFMNVPLLADVPVQLLSLLLGSAGFAVVGTVFAATLLRVRSRDVLLPVMLYPILIPHLYFGASTTEALLKPTPDYERVWYWIERVGVFDAAFLVLSVWIFESLVIE